MTVPPNADYGAPDDRERLDAEAFAIACHRLGVPAEYWSRALAAAEEHMNAERDDTRINTRSNARAASAGEPRGAQPPARCWQCGAPAAGEIPTGPPEHTWRWWCRSCLDARVSPNDGSRA